MPLDQRIATESDKMPDGSGFASSDRSHAREDQALLRHGFASLPRGRHRAPGDDRTRADAASRRAGGAGIVGFQPLPAQLGRPSPEMESSRSEPERHAAPRPAERDRRGGEFLPVIAWFFGQLQQGAGDNRGGIAGADIIGFPIDPTSSAPLDPAGQRQAFR